AARRRRTALDAAAGASHGPSGRAARHQPACRDLRTLAPGRGGGNRRGPPRHAPRGAMTVQKRLFDFALALLLLVPLGIVMAVVTLALLAGQGRPVLYGAERMHAPGHPFTLWKFRTMRPATGDSGVSGGDKAARITGPGRFLRRTRLDELPQLFNILRGDMSFVGPRPPLRQYVEAFPALYAEVLACRPGVTGLATLVFHRHEERILA